MVYMEDKEKILTNSSDSFFVELETYLVLDWSDWINNVSIRKQDNGQVVLNGVVTDQSALFGLIRRLRDRGGNLISVNRQFGTSGSGCGSLVV